MLKDESFNRQKTYMLVQNYYALEYTNPAKNTLKTVWAQRSVWMYFKMNMAKNAMYILFFLY